MATELDYEPDVCDECGVDKGWMDMRFDRLQLELDKERSKIAELEGALRKIADIIEAWESEGDYDDDALLKIAKGVLK